MIVTKISVDPFHVDTGPDPDPWASFREKRIRRLQIRPKVEKVPTKLYYPFFYQQPFYPFNYIFCAILVDFLSEFSINLGYHLLPQSVSGRPK